MLFWHVSELNRGETVDKVIESELLRMVGNLLMSNIGQDERKRAVFRSRRMYQTDFQSDLATDEDRGRAEGRTEGIVSALSQLLWTIIQVISIGWRYAPLAR